MNEQASEWSHLPLAAHIDWIIQDVEPNPSDWDTARGAARGAAYQAAYQAARGAVWDAGRDAAWDAAYKAARDAARGAVWDAGRDAGRAGHRPAAWWAARDAALALIAYDHAGALFDRPLEQVRVMAYLGQPAAILMLPACEVRARRDNGGPSRREAL